MSFATTQLTVCQLTTCHLYLPTSTLDIIFIRKSTTCHHLLPTSHSIMALIKKLIICQNHSPFLNLEYTSTSLPPSLTHLTFDKRSQFNQEVNNPPHTLTHLAFGKKFNQQIDNLPQSLTSLTFEEFLSR